MQGSSALDQSLFAPGPNRDERFVVKERWIDCENYPEGHALHKVQFVHRQMNEEVIGLECSARCLSDFPEAEWELRMWLARQCSDEARHGHMFRRLLESLGGRVGEFPVMDFQYRIINKADSLVGRLTIQNRTFEAGGLDAVSSVAEEVRKSGDMAMADFFDSQLADEILHVRFANEWVRRAIKDDPRALLRMGTAMRQAAQAFGLVMGTAGTEGINYPTDERARLEAGFTPEEVSFASELAHRAGVAQGGHAKP